MNEEYEQARQDNLITEQMLINSSKMNNSSLSLENSGKDELTFNQISQGTDMLDERQHPKDGHKTPKQQARDPTTNSFLVSSQR